MGKKSKKQVSSSESSDSSSENDASKAKLVDQKTPSGRGSNASKQSSSAKRSSSAGRNSEPVDENAVTYEYQKFGTALDAFKKTEPQTMSKLERLAKNATQGSGSGMNDAVQKTEAIRNWREQTWKADVLCANLNTDEKRGLTAD